MSSENLAPTGLSSRREIYTEYLAAQPGMTPAGLRLGVAWRSADDGIDWQTIPIATAFLARMPDFGTNTNASIDGAATH